MSDYRTEITPAMALIVKDSSDKNLVKIICNFSGLYP